MRSVSRNICASHQMNTAHLKFHRLCLDVRTRRLSPIQLTLGGATIM